MDTKELYEKWKLEVKNHLVPKKCSIPEIDTKSFLKENIPKITSDINTVFHLSGEEISLVVFIKDLIEYSTTLYTGFGIERGVGANPHSLPGLDFYDNNRDYYTNGEMVKYQGAFGRWTS